MGRKFNNTDYLTKAQRRQHEREEKERARMAKMEARKPKFHEFSPKNPRQAEYISLIQKYPLVLATGAAGTGKTALAVNQGMRMILSEGSPYQKLIVVRPAIEADGEQIGFLPGDVDEKMSPYLQPIFDSIGKSYNHPKNFIADYVEVAALAFMRGRTMENCVVILDEAQNTTPSQMLMFLTRLGERCKAIVTGDLDQHDLRGRPSGLSEAIHKLEGSQLVAVMEFSEVDVVRSRLAREVLNLWDEGD